MVMSGVCPQHGEREGWNWEIPQFDGGGAQGWAPQQRQSHHQQSQQRQIQVPPEVLPQRSLLHGKSLQSSILTSPTSFTLAVSHPFHTGQRNPPTPGFYLQLVQLAFIPGSDDSAVVISAPYRPWWKPDTRVDTLMFTPFPAQCYDVCLKFRTQIVSVCFRAHENHSVDVESRETEGKDINPP